MRQSISHSPAVTGPLGISNAFLHLIICSVAQPCLTLDDPMDCSPPGSSVHGILQSRILEWVAMPFSRGSSWPRNRTLVSCISCTGKWILYHCNTQEALILYRKFKNKSLVWQNWRLNVNLTAVHTKSTKPLFTTPSKAILSLGAGATVVTINNLQALHLLTPAPSPWLQTDSLACWAPALESLRVLFPLLRTCFHKCPLVSGIQGALSLPEGYP